MTQTTLITISLLLLAVGLRPAAQPDVPPSGHWGEHIGYIWVGKNGNSEDILKGFTATPQLFPDFRPVFKDTGNSVQSRLYVIESERDVYHKLQMTLDTFRHYGFASDFSEMIRQSQRLFIYEVSISRKICEMGVIANIGNLRQYNIPAMKYREFVTKFGKHLVTRQQVNSYVYLFVNVKTTENISQQQMRALFEHYQEQDDAQVVATAQVSQGLREKEILSRIEYTIDGIDRSISAKEIFQLIRAGQLGKIPFRTPLRTRLTFADLPALFHKYPQPESILKSLLTHQYALVWMNSDNDSKRTLIDKVTVAREKSKLTAKIHYRHQDGYLAVDTIDGNIIEGTWHQYYPIGPITKHISGKMRLQFKDSDLRTAEGWWYDNYTKPYGKKRMLLQQVEQQ